MTKFTVYPRSDCDETDLERFTIVAPNGCALPLKPLTERQAKTLSNLLNTFVDDSETV